MKLFEQIDINEFLNHYWEKKPYVFRNINFNKLEISKKDLLTMALDEYYETRCISQQKDSWNVEDGPFNTKVFKDQNKLWTLIAHNIEFYLPEVARLKEELNFLPKWLFDDVMATYSTPHSSVGAHIDNYNVFIMQTMGTRKWLLQHDPSHEYVEGLPVRILKEFNPDTEIELNEGDMIYIPPHIAHHGISMDESISISFGYKSLENKAIIDQLSVNFLNQYTSDDFYKTAFKRPQREPNTIDQDFIDDLFKHIQKDLLNKDFFTKSIAALNSESKRPTEEIDLTKDEFLMKAKTTPLFKDEFTRHCIAMIQNQHHIFINQNEFILDSEQIKQLNTILTLTHQDPIFLEKNQNIQDEIYYLTKLGILFFEQ